MRRNTILLACVSLGVLVLCGLWACKQKPPHKDAFLEKWKIMSGESEGHSPSQSPNSLERRYQPMIKKKEFALPTMPVSLRMHKADINAVLQALARAAGQSIMVSPKVEGKVTVNIENKPWDVVFDNLVKTNGLVYLWEEIDEGDINNPSVAGIIRVVSKDDLKLEQEMIQLNRQQRAEEKLRELDNAFFVTETIPIKYADADLMADNLSAYIQYLMAPYLRANFEASAGDRAAGGGGDANRDFASAVPVGNVLVDNSTNSLIISCLSDYMDDVFQMINKLDQPRKQVHIKAHIVETTSDTARQLGIQWGGMYRKTGDDGNTLWVVPGGTNGQVSGDTFTHDARLGTGSNPNGFALNFAPSGFPTGGTNIGPGAALGLMFGILGNNLIEMQLNALEQANKVNILSSPSITTLDNQTARTLDGTDVPVQTISALGMPTVRYVPAYLELIIRPHVIDNEYLQLNITIKKDEVDPNLSNRVQGNPLIFRKETTTRLITRTRETVVISGLTRSRESEGENGLPGVKDLPLLGWLAKSESKSQSNNDVLIFITPSILAQWQPGETQRSLEEVQEQVDTGTGD